jgi:hypothetical protein
VAKRQAAAAESASLLGDEAETLDILGDIENICITLLRLLIIIITFQSVVECSPML